MSCILLNPTAMDQLNQLGGLADIFNTAVEGITTAGNWIATNEKAIVNIMNATSALRNQGAATARNVNQAYQQSLKGKAAPIGMSTLEWEAMQRAGAYGTPLPSWLLPVGLGLGAIVLVMLVGRRNG